MKSVFLFFSLIIYCNVYKCQRYAIIKFAYCGYNETEQYVREVWGMNSNDPVLAQIGKRIYQCRKKLGLTQEELAELADVTPQFVSFAESGKRAMRVDNIVKLAGALRVSVDYLLTGDLVDKDLLFFAEKLRGLTVTQLANIETIVNACVALAEDAH